MKRKSLDRNEMKDKIKCTRVYFRSGIYTARHGFFFQHGRDAGNLQARVVAAYPNAQILDMGTKYTAFRGGAPLERQSHWWVKFTLKKESGDGE